MAASNAGDPMNRDERKDEVAWLCENGEIQPSYITVENGMLTWTKDHLKALRLSRRVDAEMIAEICEDCWRVAEHMWPASQPSPQRSEGVEALCESILQLIEPKFAKPPIYTVSRDILKAMLADLLAAHTVAAVPRCPECQDHNLIIDCDWSMSPSVNCGNCDAEFNFRTLSDFAQFFAPKESGTQCTCDAHPRDINTPELHKPQCPASGAGEDKQ